MGEWPDRNDPRYERAKREHLAAIRERETRMDPTPPEALCTCEHRRDQHQAPLPALCLHGIPEELLNPKEITKGWVEAMATHPGCRCPGFCPAPMASTTPASAGT